MIFDTEKSLFGRTITGWRQKNYQFHLTTVDFWPEAFLFKKQRARQKINILLVTDIVITFFYNF